jgi:hypothetical protein
MFRRRPDRRSAPEVEPVTTTGNHGPYDAGARDGAAAVALADAELDLGSLRLPAVEGVTLELCDGAAGTAATAATAVVVRAGGAAMELSVFAAPTSGRLWDGVQDQLVADGATVGTENGRYGPELRLADGSKVVGIDGPRWFLRAVVTFDHAHQTSSLPRRPTLTGSEVLDDVLARLVVVRGSAAAPPHQPLPLHPVGADEAGAESAAATAAAANAELARRPGGSATIEVHPPVHELTPPFTAGLSRNLSTWG